ncbi:MAG: HDIG domain-containing protein [Bacteroidaceae bacterium]|nr:HDIG domain-containing protein [Bacteroidaceae bacterium]
MSRYNRKRIINKREYLYRIAGLIAMIAVLALFLPKGGYTKYEYRVGEPWDDVPVIAQDSFPVYKSEAQLKRESDSLRNYYEPYFEVKKSVYEKQATLLKENFMKTLHDVIPAYYLPHLLEKLRFLYTQGIVDAEDYDVLKKENTHQVWLFEGYESQPRYVKQLYTEKTAYEYMMAEEDSVRFNHGKLLRCGLEKFVQPNLVYDAEKSLQQRQEVDAQLVPYIGQVQVGQKLVDHGQIVDDYTYCVLQSMERFQQTRSLSITERLLQLGGQVTYIAIMVILLLFYFEQFRSDYLANLRTVMLVISLFVPFPLATYALMSHSLMSVYVIPYCILPIFIRVFMDSRTAFITHTLCILTCAVALHHPYEFIVTQLVAGLVAIYSLRQLSQRSELVRAAALVTVTTLVTYFCIELLHGSPYGSNGFDRWTYIFILMAGILSLLSYTLLMPIERIFGFTSNVTLVELSNINNVILRRLSEEAPGTFQHSMQVANLAAEVANSIGAKSQLVRTGALYHDIGKLENPVFFTENQSGTNPHDNLPYEQSAQIIIQHVKNGLRLADKYQLPSVIKEFISTHHGQSMARYFYVSYKNAFPEKKVDERVFSYPGPNPTTLEQAILMMADSVEAASRSLSEYTEESLNNMVDRIIDDQITAGYFNQCPISFLEIADAKEILKTKLRTMYHTRIQYPELMGK